MHGMEFHYGILCYKDILKSPIVHKRKDLTVDNVQGKFIINTRDGNFLLITSSMKH